MTFDIGRNWITIMIVERQKNSPADTGLAIYHTVRGVLCIPILAQNRVVSSRVLCPFLQGGL